MTIYTNDIDSLDVGFLCHIYKPEDVLLLRLCFKNGNNSYISFESQDERDKAYKEIVELMNKAS